MKLILILILFVFAQNVVFASEGLPMPTYMKKHIMVVSVSSDGRYAITTDLYKHAVLWNLQEHSYKIIAKDANVYSAYFIKHTNDYMYQNDASNEVVVKNVDGKIVKKFNPGFASYGQILASNEKQYAAPDKLSNVFLINTSTGKKKQLNISYCIQNYDAKPYHGSIPTSACTGFVGAGKLLNLAFSPKYKYLTGSGFSRLYIWNLLQYTGKVIEKNDAQTFATISPGGQYVVSGGQSGNIYVFDLASGKYVKAIERFKYQTVTLKFIANDQLMAFFYGGPPLVTIYSFPEGKTLKQISLLTPKQQKANKAGSYTNDYGNDGSFPVSNSYVRDQAIDTSPSAHVLVMAMSGKNGIVVYHYNPNTQTLKQVWAAVVKPKSHHWWGML